MSVLDIMSNKKLMQLSKQFEVHFSDGTVRIFVLTKEPITIEN